MAHENHAAFATDNGKKVHAALSDPRFKFRTVVGLSKATSLPEREVLDVLVEGIKEGVVLTTKNASGTAIVCLAD